MVLSMEASSLFPLDQEAALRLADTTSGRSALSRARFPKCVDLSCLRPGRARPRFGRIEVSARLGALGALLALIFLVFGWALAVGAMALSSRSRTNGSTASSIGCCSHEICKLGHHSDERTR